MPRSLILHIGTMKTGSTTIQTLLRHNRAALRDRGICYAGSQNLNNHVVWSYTFSSTAGLPYPAAGPQWGGRNPTEVMEEACTQFRQEMADLPPSVERVIVSSEMLSQYVYYAKDMRRLRDLISPYFDQIEVLVYLRRQDGHVASNYSQSLRRGVLQRPSLVAWKDKNKGFTYDYDRLLSPWAEVFGEAAIKPRIFERDTNKNWDVVADFTEAAGTGALAAPARPFKQNPSMNLAGQGVLREIGWLLKGDEDDQEFAHTKLWHRLTAETTRALPGRGWQPTQAEARDFVARFAEANESVRRRWLPERARLFSNNYGHLPEKAPKPESDQDLRAVSAVLVHVLRKTLDQESKQRARARRSVAVKRALRLNKDDPAARLELARLMMEGGEFDTARKHVERLLKQAPDHEGARALEREIEAQAASESADQDEVALSWAEA